MEGSIQDFGSQKEPEPKLTPYGVVPGPQANVDSVQDTKDGETPGNAIDDNDFAVGEELINNGA
jgi:hypothetical protein